MLKSNQGGLESVEDTKMCFSLTIAVVPLVPTLTSFVTDIFNDCCPFLHSPVPLLILIESRFELFFSPLDGAVGDGLGMDVEEVQ